MRRGRRRDGAVCLRRELNSLLFLALFLIGKIAEIEVIDQFLQLEASAAMYNIYTIINRALIWPRTGVKADIFPRDWFVDPLTGDTKKATQYHDGLIKVAEEIIKLMKTESQNPLAKTCSKLALLRHDAAEDTMTTFLSMSAVGLRILPSTIICSIMVNSAKLLTEVQAASMQHFDQLMPREKTWNFVMSQVGAKLTLLGDKDMEGRDMFRMSGTIVTSMHQVIEKWKSIFKKRPSQSRRSNSIELEPGMSTSSESNAINMDAFWANDPLDTFFANLFHQEGQAVLEGQIPTW